ncbi:MAG: hypothetical protein ACE5JI_08740, partial [Acidobacteriota bacterium]
YRRRTAEGVLLDRFYELSDSVAKVEARRADSLADAEWEKEKQSRLRVADAVVEVCLRKAEKITAEDLDQIRSSVEPADSAWVNLYERLIKDRSACANARESARHR